MQYIFAITYLAGATGLQTCYNIAAEPCVAVVTGRLWGSSSCLLTDVFSLLVVIEVTLLK